MTNGSRCLLAYSAYAEHRWGAAWLHVQVHWAAQLWPAYASLCEFPGS